MNSAFAIGLRPEFALQCGMHPDHKCSAMDRERWYIHTPAQHVEDLVKEHASLLRQLWRNRAENKLKWREKAMEGRVELENV